MRRAAGAVAGAVAGSPAVGRPWGARRTETRTEASDGVLKEIGKWVLIVVLWMLPWWLIAQIARWAWDG